MPETYLLPCSHCQASIEITPKFAGQAVSCKACEESVQAPAMREIRQLPLVDEAKTEVRRGARSTSKSWLFSGGLLLAVVTAAIGFFLWNYASSLQTERTVERDIEFGHKLLDEATPGVVWDAWSSMSKTGLPDWKETKETRYNKQAGILKNFAYGLGGLSLLGLLLMISSFFIRTG